jgi:FimV-like protein
MGDPEGAKTILQEIINEGNDAQKSRAEKLLNDLQ